MLTLFSIPKPFSGRTGEIQRNALASWAALGEGIQVVLVGDGVGVAEAARDTGAEHVGSTASSERGTPRLDHAFAQVDAIARHPWRCFVNADVVFLDDLVPAVKRIVDIAPRSLTIGRCWDLDLSAGLDVSTPDWATRLRLAARRDGVLRGAAALDWFVFPAGLFDPMPPFLVGRAGFDNWLVWKARRQGMVVDATHDVTAVHQRHDYDHLAGGKDEAYYGDEAAANLALVGGKSRLFTAHDASHVLRDGSLRRNHGSTLRARETARKAAWKLGLR
ncbi:MAG TPA: hypothetical protein VEH55_02700 [Gaiellaceae bacterium]|nr:hypothetical protein [Gaiellaceae bacterium]